MFNVSFETNNAAFEGDPAQECIWVLQQISQAVRAGSVGGNCVDSNGNAIGTWELVADRDDEEDEEEDFDSSEF